MIRSAEARDVDAIARIYNQAPYMNIELSSVSHENRRQWLSARLEPVAAWVYELSAYGVVGYCGLSPFSLRPNCRTVVEMALYVDRDHRSHLSAIAMKLLAHIVNQARNRGFRSLIANPLAVNTPSIAGLAGYGFIPIATLRSAAWTPGGWADVLWMKKDLTLPDPERFHRIRRAIQLGRG